MNVGDSLVVGGSIVPLVVLVVVATVSFGLFGMGFCSCRFNWDDNKRDLTDFLTRLKNALSSRLVSEKLTMVLCRSDGRDNR